MQLGKFTFKIKVKTPKEKEKSNKKIGGLFNKNIVLKTRK